MKLCKGYCDFRVDFLDDGMIDEYIDKGFKCIALNTTVDASVINVGCPNKKKRKKGNSNLNEEESEWIPPPSTIKEYDGKEITIYTRLTLKISGISQFHNAMYCPNYKLYNIHAVEPLNTTAMQEVVAVNNIDIISCSLVANLSVKDYKTALLKAIHFELLYAPMLSNSVTRQECLTLAHILHMRGKSKNLIISSGAVHSSQLRNVHDVMNVCTLLGLSRDQASYAITRGCHKIVHQIMGRIIGKCALTVRPKE